MPLQLDSSSRTVLAKHVGGLCLGTTRLDVVNRCRNSTPLIYYIASHELARLSTFFIPETRIAARSGAALALALALASGREMEFSTADFSLLFAGGCKTIFIPETGIVGSQS